MAVTVYRSSDASAPTLNGSSGSLIAVLDACLVTGYGAKAAAGWEKAFSGTNLAAYRAATGNRYYLRVDDTGTTEARIVGYEVMTTVNAGTAPFPTAAQQSGGLYARKSEVADTSARGWVVVATGTCFYFLPQTNNSDWTVDPSYQYICGQFFFGDFSSFKSGDTFNTAIIAASGSGTSAGRLGSNAMAPNTSPSIPGHYVCRGFDGGGASKACGKRALYDVTQRTPFGTSSYPSFPCVVTGDLLVSPIVILETDAGTTTIQRGVLPGLWALLNALPGAHADTISGTGTLVGKSFQLINVSDTATVGRAMIETSNTW
jgi:hypothetical protein